MLTGVCVAELWLLRNVQRRADKALAVLTQKRLERDSLARQIPAPTAEHAVWIAAETDKARATLARLQGEFAVNDTSPEPMRPVDGYFALNDICQKLLRLSAEAGVEVAAGERFGFASHAREGPAAEILPVVHRQALLTERLVAALVEARPAKLLTVRREEPGGDGAGRAPAGAADFHVPPPVLLVRQPGYVESDAFRLEFTGRTSVLRKFLRSLAASSLPAIVRSVEVEPVAKPRMPDAAAASHGPVKFSVLLEVPRLVTEAKP